MRKTISSILIFVMLIAIAFVNAPVGYAEETTAEVYEAYVKGTKEKSIDIWIDEGETIILSVEATAAGDPQYSWMFSESAGGVGFFGENKSDLEITGKTGSQKSYQCTVGFSDGTSTSVNFRVHFSGLKAYVADEAETTRKTYYLKAGREATLSVDAHSENGDVRYSWSGFYMSGQTGGHLSFDDAKSSSLTINYDMFSMKTASQDLGFTRGSVTCLVEDAAGNIDKVEFDILNDDSDDMGWYKRENGEWAYINPDGGLCMNGWKKIDGEWYFFRNTTMQTGWLQEGKSWYYLRPSGKMATGWVQDNGAWYYMKSSGAMATGWVNDGGTWYYMNSSGQMMTGWIQDGGTWYFLKSSGAMAANEYVNGYWLNGNGSWTYPHKATWRKSGDRWWYGDASGWYAANATYRIDGVEYSFDAAGWMK